MTSLSGWLLKGRIEQNRIVAEPAYHVEAFLEQRVDERLFEKNASGNYQA